jgi:very-short-patch-repair endonuclease
MRVDTQTLKRARRLRAELTPIETRLWVRLRSRVEGRPTFRRQHAEGPYVLDFYCAAAKLAVEADGGTHGVGDQPQRDARKDSWLQRQGISVLRISGQDIMADPDGVADGIIRLAISRVGALKR